MIKQMRCFWLAVLFMPGCAIPGALGSGRESQPIPVVRGTAALGLIIERASGSVLVFDSVTRSALCRVEGLGDLSHASAVFSRDARYGYVFGRDGGLTKVDLLTCRIDHRIVQGGNAIGGAISQNGRVIGVSNYEPGGVRFFDADTLAALSEITTGVSGVKSKTVGLVDAPDQQFAVALYEAGELWLMDASDPTRPGLRRYAQAGALPYDALMSPDGRYFVAGLFGEPGMALLDLWHPEQGVRRVLDSFDKGAQKLPVYKMPHLEGCTFAGGRVFVPAVGSHEVLVARAADFSLEKRIPVLGQPVFTVARPDGREIWVNFALPDNGNIQVLDPETGLVTHTLQPGPAVLHMEFTPKGDEVYVSVRDADVVIVYDTRTKRETARLPAHSPSGIFLAHRAGRIGQ